MVACGWRRSSDRAGVDSFGDAPRWVAGRLCSHGPDRVDAHRESPHRASAAGPDPRGRRHVARASSAALASIDGPTEIEQLAARVPGSDRGPRRLRGAAVSPGPPRPVDRSCQPRRCSWSDSTTRWSEQHDATCSWRRAVHRPRPIQAHQRQPRSRCRRHRPGRDRSPRLRNHSCQRHARPIRWRRICRRRRDVRRLFSCSALSTSFSPASCAPIETLPPSCASRARSGSPQVPRGAEPSTSYATPTTPCMRQRKLDETGPSDSQAVSTTEPPPV